MINYLQVDLCCSIVLSMFPCAETFCMSKFCVISFLLHFTLFLAFLVQSSLVLHFHIVVEWTFVSLCHFFACWSFVLLKLFKHFRLIFPFSLRACPFYFLQWKRLLFFQFASTVKLNLCWNALFVIPLYHFFGMPKLHLMF
jgi:hypothetical protein